MHYAAPRSARTDQLIIVIQFDLLIGNKHLCFFATEAKGEQSHTGRFWELFKAALTI